jgi:hypothetical protein
MSIQMARVFAEGVIISIKMGLEIFGLNKIQLVLGLGQG